jgi:hypothetical protein
MSARKRVALLLVVALLIYAVPAYAQEGEGEVLPCEGTGVAGTVVEVNDNTVTIDTGEGLCTVTLDGEFDHPITSLLGSYFGEVNAESLASALEATQGCVLEDTENGTWTWVDCETEGAVDVTLTGENDDGTFVAMCPNDVGELEECAVTVEDPDIAEELSSALDSLAVDWELGEEGSLVQAGDEIAGYHEEGVGFGVLVKLYALAAESMEACAEDGAVGDEPCGLSVGDLLREFNGGTGLGQLFKEYGRPSIRGVGHVRHGRGAGGPPEHSNAGGNGGDDEDNPESRGNGNRNSNGNDNGNGNGNGPPDHSNAGGNGNGRGNGRNK